jgi:uncharacterized membrane protein
MPLRSRVIVALATAFDAAFWLLLVWAPIGWVIGVALVKPRNAALLAVAGLLACVVGALIARVLGRGLWSGHRVAFAVVCLLLLGAAGYHFWRLTFSTFSTAILAVMRALAYVALAVSVATSAIRGEESP